jgi:hypothetical protein
MVRDKNFTLRTSPAEREMISAVAQKLERTETDALRLLIRQKARELGIAPTNDERQRAHAAGVSV